MPARLAEEQRQFGVREELRLLWWYERWNAAPFVVRSFFSGLGRIVAGAAVGATLSQLVIGSAWVSSFVGDLAGVVAGAGLVWWSSRWPWRTAMTNHLSVLHQPNWSRGADIYVARENYAKACVALHRDGLVTRGGIQVYDGVPGRPELNFRLGAYEPLPRVTEVHSVEGCRNRRTNRRP